MKHTLVALVTLAACGSHPATPRVDPPCREVADHMVAIGRTDDWIREARDDGTLPVDGVSDRDGLRRFFELACEANVNVAQRRCIVAQRTWEDVEHACGPEKVWWYTPG